MYARLHDVDQARSGIQERRLYSRIDQSAATPVLARREEASMKIKTLALALCVVSAGAFVLPDVTQARGGFHGGGFHGGGFHGGGFAGGMRPGWHGGGTHWAGGGVRPGWNGAGTRWSGNGYWRGGRYYGWGAAAGAAAAGAALGAGYYGSYNNNCYEDGYGHLVCPQY